MTRPEPVAHQTDGAAHTSSMPDAECGKPSTTSSAVVENLDLLLDVLPAEIRDALIDESGLENLLEVILDLGRQPEARYLDKTCFLLNAPVSHDDIAFTVSRVGMFTHDNRAGIPRTLHRISAIRNRTGEAIGLTCRVGRCSAQCGLSRI